MWHWGPMVAVASTVPMGGGVECGRLEALTGGGVTKELGVCRS